MGLGRVPDTGHEMIKNMMELNAKWLVTVQSFELVRDSAYLVAACTWEITDKTVTIINTPTAVAEIILTRRRTL